MKALPLLFVLSVIFCAGCASVEYRTSGRLAVIQKSAAQLGLSQRQQIEIEHFIASAGTVKITSITRISQDEIRVCYEGYRAEYPKYEQGFIARSGEDTVQESDTIVHFQPFTSNSKKDRG